MAVTFDPSAKNARVTLSNGNLTATGDGSANWQSVLATLFVPSGKWYTEITISAVGTSIMMGLGPQTASLADGSYPGFESTSYGYYYVDGKKFTNNVGTAYGATYGNGAVISVLFDGDNDTITFWKNGVTQGQAFASVTGTLSVFIGLHGSASAVANFGGSAFTYTPPAGYFGLNSFTGTHGDAAVSLQSFIGEGRRIAAGVAIMEPMQAGGGHNGLGSAILQQLQVAGGGGIRSGVAVFQQLIAQGIGHSASYSLSAFQPFDALGAGTVSSIIIADTTLPVLQLDSTGLTGSKGTRDGVIPLPTLEAGNNGASIDLLMLELDALLTVGVSGQFVGTLPILTNEATGFLSILATGNSTFPAFTLEAVGLGENQGAFSGNIPKVYTVAMGFSGGVAALAAQAPVLSLNAIGYGPYVGTAGLILEPVHLDADGFSAVAAALRTWVLNLRKKGLTEYNNFNFNSYAEYRETVLAAGPAGIVKLSATNTDAGTAIGAQVRTGAESFGTSYNKRVPRIYVGYSTDGAMHFSTITSQDGKRTYLLPHNGITKIQQRRVPVGRGPKSPYWQYEFANVAGSDFLLEHVQVYPEKTSRRVV